MRWRALFEDLEGQVEAAERAELDAEVRDRTRREASLVRMSDRLRAAAGQPLVLTLPGAGAVHGVLADVGEDWLLLEEPAAGEVLVPMAAVLTVAGLGRRTQAPGSEGVVAARLDLRWALRGLARSRATVHVVLRDSTLLVGTLDRVGADHVELAEHAPGEPRRPGAVTGVRLVPVAALALLRRH